MEGAIHLKRMKTLITGGAGFIGSHTALDLWKNGHQVSVVDNYSTSSSRVKTNINKLAGHEIEFFEGDIRDQKFIFQILKSKEIELVIHLAGLKSIKGSFNNPKLYDEINVQGTKALVKTMQECQVKKLIFSSSATVYGMPGCLPIIEKTPLKPIHPYGKNKTEIECFLKEVSHKDSLWRIINFRYFNPIGAHHSLEIGENMFSEPNNLVPFILKVLLQEKDELSIFGNDYNTPDGTGVRDYVHIEDIARAHSKGISYIDNLEEGFQPFNLGSGVGYSVLEIISAFEKVTGKKIPYKFSKRRDGDVASLYADISSARKKLLWEPTYSLEDMCASAYHFALKNNY